MADDPGDRFNSSHAEPSTYGSGANGGFGNDGHEKTNGNDEGWLSDFIGEST